MNKYQIRSTGQVVTLQGLMEAFPTTSFPAELDSATLDHFGVDLVLPGDMPVAKDRYHTPVEDGVEKIDGKLYTKYVQSPVFTDYTDDAGVVHTAAEQDAAHVAKMDAAKSAEVRAIRNKLLADSDWTQISDATVDKAAWLAYRQELRDITATPGFPWNVVWPMKPE